MMSAFAAANDAALGIGRGSLSSSGAGGASDVREAVNRAAAAAAAASSSSSREVIEIDDGPDGDADGVVGGDGASSGGGHTTNLSEMFAPPTRIMHTAGGFQGARNVARDARRWLLVNLQRDSDFACHALNRDVWRDELVENLVREGFVFWQATDVSNDGSTYAQRYSVLSYPHVAIIDPRTGRLMWKKEGWTQVDPMTAEQFAELAADFCSRHSFHRPPVAPRPTSSTSASASAASNSSSAGGPSASMAGAAAAKKRPMREMTEEEQLQAAIQASMQNGDDDGNNHDGDDDMDQGSDDEMIMDDSDEDEDEDEYEYDAGEEDTAEVVAEVAPPPEVAASASPLRTSARGNGEARPPARKRQEEAKKEEEEEEKPKAAVVEAAPPTFEEGLLTAEVGDEPTSGDVARVQIRMPDGKRLVRKFRGNDPVRTIYAFVAQSGGEGTRPFELRAGFPPRDIRPKVDETIKGCGLAGEAISMRWTSS
uniref:UBX domain-containing protein n=1 Tax=Odontella aurita TaxID=265563 RepID=A0A7S4JAM3_9STRA